MIVPLRILAVAPQPADAPWSAVAAASIASIQAILRPIIVSGRVELVTLAPPTANALEEQLAVRSWNVLHLIGRGTSRAAARHGTVTLEGTDRRMRDLNAQNVARLCGAARDLELVVLQALPSIDGDLSVLRDTVSAQVETLVYVPSAVSAARAETFLRRFYTAAAAGDPPATAFDLGIGNPTALPVGSVRGSEPELVVNTKSPRVISRQRGNESVGQPAATAIAVSTIVPASEDKEAEARRQVDQKRLARAFDVFLCHNVGDKPSVMEIGRRLMSRGVLPWLDQWELRPGMPWQRLLEEQIGRIGAAAVFVGPEGIGPWQRQELDGFLREFNNRGCPVIPVMLHGAAAELELPLFLRGMTWVDFRVAEPDPLNQLIWGVTGRRPDS